LPPLPNPLTLSTTTNFAYNPPHGGGGECRGACELPPLWGRRRYALAGVAILICLSKSRCPQIRRPPHPHTFGIHHPT
jgi:hypothetical protein